MYTHREDLSPRGQQRILAIFTVANVGGGGVGAILGWQLARPLDQSLVTVLLVAVGIAGGVVSTMRWGGLSLLDRLVVWLGYLWQRSLGPVQVVPQRPVGRTLDLPQAVAVVRDGQVVVRPYTPPTEERV